MGGSDFSVRAKGKTARDAFNSAVQEARYESGHGGYTGTIAEKRDFVMVTVPKGKDPRAFVNELISAGDDRYEDKWGPALCVRLTDEPGESFFLFFGVASS